ncbi:uncharacterized protein LOC129576560 isoform X2 [Sitodiplosis mosellana]|uniref:uncharacterized protein LOC129576560 isoform X2 n=1 Tax=Sitodiplosis mosellana TaxID=263140 RepID=UPI0024448F47|nr:uncharacterized protein LOC129576560 isoform X2 [Sitodiplosis mosellana]XP_055317763.1 uncharacterized protein LOC129576560 isoform X2 [Sitodiplosis mosellana]XP_055317764.1 uncharacterized protein LOC129576560 isoform X2 [Sitodiplosis mosellana]
MSDLADQIDDYICTFDAVGDLTMDTLAMFIFGWALLALFLLWLCKFLYNKYVKKDGGAGGAGVDSTKYGISPSEKNRRSESKELSTSKDIKGLDLAAKPLGKIGVASQARKRLSRKSPGPELRKTLRSIPPPTNVTGPETSSVAWTSQIFRWLYSDLVIVNDLLQTWVQALNDHMKKNAEENGVDIEIVRVLPESPSPNLANIFCNSTETDPSDMTITLDSDATPVFQIKVHRLRAGKMETSHYKVTVSRLRARLSIKISYTTLKGEMMVEGYPDIRIALNSIGAIKTVDLDEKQLQESVSNILASAIRLCVYPIDFSIYAACPRAHEDSRELSYDLDRLNNSSSSSLQGVSSGRRLLVKVVKGEGLVHATDPFCIIEMDEPQQKNQTGARQGTNPYWDEHFLFELSPSSAEILFEVYDRNPTGIDEPPKFLGLGLVGVDELAVGPASSQILALQPRPYESDDVSGAITVEFVFIEGAEVPCGRRPYKMKEALKISNTQPNGVQNGGDLADTAIRALEGGALSYNGNPSKSTLIIHSVQRVELNSDGKIQLEETINESIINGNANTTANVSDSTFDDSKNVTQASDKTDASDKEGEPTAAVLSIDDPESGEIYKNHLISNNINNNHIPSKTDNQSADAKIDAPNITADANGNSTNNKTNDANGDVVNNDSDNKRLFNNSNTDAANAPSEPLAQSSPITNYTGYQNGNGNYATTNDANQSTDPEADGLERGRSRKKRDFFGTLKRRLGRSKSRAKSLERQGAVPIDANNPNDSNALANSISGGIASNTSTGPRLVVSPSFDQSRRSSLSESSAISGFSSASARTFVHEASTLVLETIENGVKRHFLVPLSIAQRPRWRRKGTKLHIYNDHTFLAKHLSGGLLCDVCNRSIPRRPGKQGYECRDCKFKCHKQCHVRTPQACTNPTVLSMELSTLPTLPE